MRHFVRAAAVMLVLGCAAAVLPAQAAPPTVTPSPGYDQRLQESRRPTVAPSSGWQRPYSRRAPKHKRRH